jgi:hypothetical protein
MIIINLICGLLVVVCYGLSIAKQKPIIFDIGNIIFFIPLGVTSIVLGAYGGAVISFAFGFLAMYSVIRHVLKQGSLAEMD